MAVTRPICGLVTSLQLMFARLPRSLLVIYSRKNNEWSLVSRAVINLAVARALGKSPEPPLPPVNMPHPPKLHQVSGALPRYL